MQVHVPQGAVSNHEDATSVGVRTLNWDVVKDIVFLFAFLKYGITCSKTKLIIQGWDNLHTNIQENIQGIT